MNFGNVVLLSLRLIRLHWRQSASILIVVFLNLNVFLLFQQIRQSLKSNFTGVVSDVDLLVGAPTGPLSLVLASLFHKGGQVTNNVSLQTTEVLRSHKDFDWVEPISIGDAWKEYPVIAVSPSFFSHVKFRGGSIFQVLDGQWWSGPQQAVVGAAVAKKAKLTLKQSLILSHGTTAGQSTSFLQHDRHPFEVVGILDLTGTPWDYGIFVTHTDWGIIHGDEGASSFTALFVKLKNRFRIFSIQREINSGSLSDRLEEPLLAVIPSAVLSEFWQNLKAFENLFFLLGFVILGVSVVALWFNFQWLMHSRRHEVMNLRVLGVPLVFIVFYFILEMLLIFFVATAGTLVLQWLVGPVLQRMILEHFSLWLNWTIPWSQWLFSSVFMAFFVFLQAIFQFFRLRSQGMIR